MKRDGASKSRLLMVQIDHDFLEDIINVVVIPIRRKPLQGWRACLNKVVSIGEGSSNNRQMIRPINSLDNEVDQG